MPMTIHLKFDSPAGPASSPAGQAVPTSRGSTNVLYAPKIS